MMICEFCGTPFDESEIVSYRWEFEYITECPYCKSENITEAAYCEECNNWRPEEEMGEQMCSKCAAETLKTLSTFIKSTFSPAQIAFIQERVDECII